MYSVYGEINITTMMMMMMMNVFIVTCTNERYVLVDGRSLDHRHVAALLSTRL